MKIMNKVILFTGQRRSEPLPRFWEDTLNIKNSYISKRLSFIRKESKNKIMLKAV